MAAAAVTAGDLTPPGAGPRDVPSVGCGRFSAALAADFGGFAAVRWRSWLHRRRPGRHGHLVASDRAGGAGAGAGLGLAAVFRVRRSFLDRYPVHQVGGRDITECWIPAEDLGELNDSMVGPIELAAEYH